MKGNKKFLCLKRLNVRETQLMHFFMYCRQEKVVFLCVCVCVLMGHNNKTNPIILLLTLQPDNIHFSSLSSLPPSDPESSTHGLLQYRMYRTRCTVPGVGQAPPHSKHIDSVEVKLLNLRASRVQIC